MEAFHWNENIYKSFTQVNIVSNLFPNLVGFNLESKEYLDWIKLIVHDIAY